MFAMHEKGVGSDLPMYLKNQAEGEMDLTFRRNCTDKKRKRDKLKACRIQKPWGKTVFV